MQKNRIELAGYLTAAPQLRYLTSGTKVANVRMGETYRYVGKDGQQLSHTNWHSLTFYDELAEAALTCEKGDNLFVEGSLQQRQFTPADGVKRNVQEVVVRSFHLIAQTRKGSGNSEDLARMDDAAEEGVPIDATWPVGPA
jgi:single-strand DNA-binding protein